MPERFPGKNNEGAIKLFLQDISAGVEGNYIVPPVALAYRSAQGTCEYCASVLASFKMNFLFIPDNLLP